MFEQLYLVISYYLEFRLSFPIFKYLSVIFDRRKHVIPSSGDHELHQGRWTTFIPAQAVLPFFLILLAPLILDTLATSHFWIFTILHDFPISNLCDPKAKFDSIRSFLPKFAATFPVTLLGNHHRSLAPPTAPPTPTTDFKKKSIILLHIQKAHLDYY